MSEQNKDEIISQMQAEIDRLNKAITSLEEEKEDLPDQVYDLETQVSELESGNSELQSELDTQTIIKTGRDGGILYVADNLLDQQIMEALADLMENSNNVTLLQHLESLKKLGV